MKQTMNSSQVVAPFLTSYATPRTPSPEIPGYYSSEHEMWVVSINEIEEPLIERNLSISTLVTKTCTQQESDDQVDSTSFASLLTKTNTYHERDDEDSLFVLEMGTKTEAELERDDADPEIVRFFI